MDFILWVWWLLLLPFGKLLALYLCANSKIVSTMYSYTSTVLRRLSSNAKDVKLPSATWQLLQNLGICKKLRGCRAGRHKQRLINTRISWRPSWESRCCFHNVNYGNYANHGNLRSIKQHQEHVAVNKTLLPRIYLCNPRSLNNKMDEFETVIRVNNADVAVVTESWFTAK